MSELLRGRVGTEHALSSHAIGDRFVVLDRLSIGFVPIPLNLMNTPIWIKAVTYGKLLAEATAVKVTPQANHLKPLTVVKVRKVKSVDGDLTFSWSRRARVNGGWHNNADVPLDFGIEQYDVQIYNATGTTVIRQYLGLTSSQFTYTLADQTTDFGGAAPDPIKIRIWQLSDLVGRGQQSVRTL